jgi:hypothetical protein
MRRPYSPFCILDKSKFNNLINNLLSRSEIRICDLLRLFCWFCLKNGTARTTMNRIFMKNELGEIRKKPTSDASSEMSGRSRRTDISDALMIVRELGLWRCISCQI